MEQIDYERKKDLQRKLQSSLDYSREIPEEELLELIDGLIEEEHRIKRISLPEREYLRKALYNAVRKLDLLQEIIDGTYTEIMINGPNHIFVEEKGCLKEHPMRFESEEKLEQVIQQIVSSCNRAVNEASPIADARLNGSRVNIVLAPVALNGPIVTIRRFPEHPITMEDLLSFGSITTEVCTFLNRLIRAKYNILISGGTGSGKTTFLNALSAYIPRDERIITIEDNAELQILDCPNLVRLETRNANSEGCREIGIRDLIRTSLRMRPDRIIVGEVRGGEAFEMMQALNTGHDGSLVTAHANSAEDMLSRLENMILMGMEIPLPAIRRQIASGVDIIIHLGRLRDRSRKVLQIVEILGYENGEILCHPLYEFEENGMTKDGHVSGALRRKEELVHCEKLKLEGLYSETSKKADEKRERTV